MSAADHPDDPLPSNLSADQILAMRGIRELNEHARQRLEALLLEGLEGGESIIMTDAVWDEMLREFERRHPRPDNEP